MTLQEILAAGGAIVGTGVAAVNQIRGTIDSPSGSYTQCAYPDGTIIRWPTNAGPCPPYTGSSKFTGGEIAGLVLVFGAVVVILIFILSEKKRG